MNSTKAIGSCVRNLLVACENVRLPENLQKEIVLAEQVLGSSLKDFAQSCRKLMENFDASPIANINRQIFLQSAHIVAIEARNLLHAADNARLKYEKFTNGTN